MQKVIQHAIEGTPIKLAYEPKIINKKNMNAYGVLLHTRKAIEQFQTNSDMKGHYTKEYQHHYWTMNGRLAADGQVLDISIPLVLFNYEQTVTGGDIKFDLVDVEKASNALEKVASAKYQELAQTDFFKYLSEEVGITDWTFVPLNTAHVHPGGKNQSFSGIDLRQSFTYPGVVYPLTKGKNIPSFSAIMAHITGKAEIVHSEYRLFNQAENGDKVYAHGRCATIVRGYTPKPLEPLKQPDAIPQRMIDKVFNIMPDQPKKREHPVQKETPGYVLRDNLKSEDGKEFLNELQAKWEECTFEPDVSMVKKENIKTFVYKAPNYTNSRQKSFWDEEGKRSQKKQGNRDARKDNGSISVFDQKKAIVETGLATWSELQTTTHTEIEELYSMVIMLEEEESEQKKPKVNYTYNGQVYSQEEITKIRVLLEEEEYLSFAKIDDMNDYNIIAYYVNFYEYKTEETETNEI